MPLGPCSSPACDCGARSQQTAARRRDRRPGDRQPACAVDRRLRRSGARARSGPTRFVDRSGGALDASIADGRVLQLPGAEFGAYRWGYTVDQPLPGLTEQPVVTRDLLPLGSPAAMDLLYALDDRIQTGVLEPDALGPIARLLGVDTVWLTNDQAFDRFRTARPEVVRDLVLDAGDFARSDRLRRTVPQSSRRAVHRRAGGRRSARRAAGRTGRTRTPRPAGLDRAWFAGRTARLRERRRAGGRSRGRSDRRIVRGSLQRFRHGRGRRHVVGRRPGHRPGRDRLEPVARPPLAQLSGHHRAHRTRRSTARPARRGLERRPPAGVRHRLDRVDERRPAERSGRRHGDLVRGAVRLPAGAPPGDGDRRRPRHRLDGRRARRPAR